MHCFLSTTPPAPHVSASTFSFQPHSSGRPTTTDADGLQCRENFQQKAKSLVLQVTEIHRMDSWLYWDSRSTVGRLYPCARTHTTQSWIQVTDSVSGIVIDQVKKGNRQLQWVCKAACSICDSLSHTLTHADTLLSVCERAGQGTGAWLRAWVDQWTRWKSFHLQMFAKYGKLERRTKRLYSTSISLLDGVWQRARFCY